jgi:RHS repeat-associated protein
VKERYEYDAFGEAYEGDLSGGMNLGYTGKPYETVTGAYNYGYRDYRAELGRFTTEDPVRDGANWFAYVDNDPVNWIDLRGLSASDNSISSNNVKNVDILSTNDNRAEYRVEITYYDLKISDTNNSGRYELTLDKGELSLKDTTAFGHDNPYIYTTDKPAMDLANQRAGFAGNQILPSELHPDGINPGTIVVIDQMDIIYGNNANILREKGDSINVDLWGFRELPNE